MTEKGKLTAQEAAQAEALTRPVIGQQGPVSARQVEFDRELHQANREQARADLNAGRISPQQYEERTGLH